MTNNKALTWRKPLSPRRAREFKDRRCKRMFGDRKSRAERHAWLTFTYGPNVHREIRYAAKGHAFSLEEA